MSYIDLRFDVLGAPDSLLIIEEYLYFVHYKYKYEFATRAKYEVLLDRRRDRTTIVTIAAVNKYLYEYKVVQLLQCEDKI